VYTSAGGKSSWQINISSNSNAAAAIFIHIACAKAPVSAVVYAGSQQASQR
jgi:hypothetical protein